MNELLKQWMERKKNQINTNMINVFTGTNTHGICFSAQAKYTLGVCSDPADTFKVFSSISKG